LFKSTDLAIAAGDSRETLAEPKSKRGKTEPGARDHAQSVDAAADAPPPEMPIIGRLVPLRRKTDSGQSSA
jgi:hypothetical protein